MRYLLLFMVTLPSFLSTSILAKEVRTIPLKGDYSKLRLEGVLDIDIIFDSNKSEAVLDITDKYSAKVHVGVRDGEVYVEMDDIKMNKISMKNIGRLTLYLNQEINRVECDIVGNLNFRSPLIADYLDMELNHVGKSDLELRVNKCKLELAIVGNSNISGTAISADLENEGVGNLRAGDFRVKNLKIENSGVGNVEVYASGTISIENSGVGNVRYGGDAKVIREESSGIGNVRRN